MLDTLSTFSDHQAITATAASTNYMDFSKMPFAGQGDPININILVTEDFATLTSLNIKLQVSANGSTGWTDVDSGETILLAALKVGKRAALRFLPNFDNSKPYVRLYYTVAGSNATAGKIFADLESGEQKQYRSGLFFSPRNSSGAASTA